MKCWERPKVLWASSEGLSNGVWISGDVLPVTFRRADSPAVPERHGAVPELPAGADISENQITRDLIQANYVDGLRTALSDAKTQISNQAQTSYILGQIGQYYTHPSVNPNTCYNNCGCNNGCSGCNS